MHSSLVALLTKKYLYENTIKELITRYEIPDEEVQEFYDMYSGNIRSFKGDDENNIKLFFQDICKYPSLSPPEEAALIQAYLHGDQEAKGKLILHMTGYVIALAKKFMGLGIPLLDLVSEGMLGLERAITMFDPLKANRLSTYANIWITNYIITMLAEFNGSVSVPLHVIAEIKVIDHMEQRLFQLYGRPATQDEIIEAVQEENHFRRPLSSERIVKLLLIKQGPVSLSHVTEEGRDNLGASLPDTTTPSPMDEAQKKYMRSNICKLITTIAPPRDAAIIKMRYGIGGPKYTLQQIGESIGVTRERIRQIEKRFIVKVRTSPQLNMFLSM